MWNISAHSNQLLAFMKSNFGLAIRCWMIALVMACPIIVFSAENNLSVENTIVSEKSVRVDFHNGRLSVSVKESSIVELMQIVAEKAGFEVIVYGDFSNQVASETFSELELSVAIRKLLRNTNAIISYRDGPGPDNEPSVSRIFLLGSGSAKVNPIRIRAVEPGLDNQLRLDQAQTVDVQSRLAAIDRAEGLSDDIKLENLAFALQHDPDPEVRIRAITALEDIGGSTAVTALVAGLGDSDATVRKKVVQTFAKINDERIPLWLGQVLMGDPDPEVRLEAVQAVARKDGDIARIFLQAATNDSSSAVSEAALGLLR
jgi:hypothetical protein